MLILALDTSADCCSVALSDGSQELSTFRFRHERLLGERLPEIVRFLLRDRGRTLQDVEAFAVGLGPGSFTGVRVGVTLAKTWAHALNRPLVGISSLDALTAGVPPLPGVGIAAVAPTRRTEVIAAYYRSGTIIPVAPPLVTLTAEVAEHARAALANRDAPLLIVGEQAVAVCAALNPFGRNRRSRDRFAGCRPYRTTRVSAFRARRIGRSVHARPAVCHAAADSRSGR